MQLSLWVEEDVVLCLSSLWVEEVSEDEVFSSLEDEDFSSLEDEGLYPVVEVEDFSSVVEEDEDEVFFSLSVEEEDFCFSLSLEEDEDLYSVVVEVTVTVTGTVDVCSLLSLVVETVDEDFSLVVEVTGTEDVCSSVAEEPVDVVLYCSNARFVVGGV